MPAPPKEYRLIPLTQDQFALVDAKHYDALAAHKWSAWWSSSTLSFYAIRNSSTINGKRHIIRMHREVLGLKYGDPHHGDHVNHDTLNNTEDNLRIATRSQSSANRRIFKNNTSGYKGVRWHSLVAKWEGRVQWQGKTFSCGFHDTPKLASIAVRKMTLKLHGEFAMLA